MPTSSPISNQVSKPGMVLPPTGGNRTPPKTQESDASGGVTPTPQLAKPPITPAPYQNHQNPIVIAAAKKATDDYVGSNDWDKDHANQFLKEDPDFINDLQRKGYLNSKAGSVEEVNQWLKLNGIDIPLNQAVSDLAVASIMNLDVEWTNKGDPIDITLKCGSAKGKMVSGFKLHIATVNYVSQDSFSKITQGHSESLWKELIDKGYIDQQGRVLDHVFRRDKRGINIVSIELSDKFKPIQGEVESILLNHTVGNFDAYNIDGDRENPLLKIRTKDPDLTVYIKQDNTVNPNNGDPYELAIKYSGLESSSKSIDDLVRDIYIPSVDFNERGVLEPLLGATTRDKNGRPVQITEAYFQNKFKMDEKGAQAKSAVSFGLQTIGSVPGGLVVDGPFLVWFREEKTGKVLFAAHITDANMKKSQAGTSVN